MPPARGRGGGKSKGKGKGGKSKGKGKGKGGKKGWQSTRPDPIIPPGWKADRDWRCECGAYNYHYKSKCFSCQKAKPGEAHGAAVAEKGAPPKKKSKIEDVED